VRRAGIEIGPSKGQHQRASSPQFSNSARARRLAWRPSPLTFLSLLVGQTGCRFNRTGQACRGPVRHLWMAWMDAGLDRPPCTVQATKPLTRVASPHPIDCSVCTVGREPCVCCCYPGRGNSLESGIVLHHSSQPPLLLQGSKGPPPSASGFSSRLGRAVPSRLDCPAPRHPARAIGALQPSTDAGDAAAAEAAAAAAAEPGADSGS